MRETDKMAYTVTINPCLKINEIIEKIAVGIAVFEESDRENYAHFMGHYGQFENNPRAKNLHKIHIANIAGLISDNWQSKRGYHRTSDHFAVYSEHWLDKELLHLLDIITPNAHQRIDSLISDLIDKAEAFNAMTKAQIAQLKSYTANHDNQPQERSKSH